MTQLIALFRGINVGGNNIIAMKDLVGILEGTGAEDVSTYIQSGNAVLSYAGNEAELSKNIKDAISQSHGFEPRLLLLTAEKFRRVADQCPYMGDQFTPKNIHVFFLESSPDTANIEALKSLKTETEEFQLNGDVFYMHAPDGVGRSKLFAKVEAKLGVSATARNWNTIQKLLTISAPS